jgi:hypothetical protein
LACGEEKLVRLALRASKPAAVSVPSIVYVPALTVERLADVIGGGGTAVASISTLRRLR